MLTTREVPVEANEDPCTELLLGEEVVAYIQHTEDDRYILFEVDEADTVTMIDDYSTFHLALNVARTIYH